MRYSAAQSVTQILSCTYGGSTICACFSRSVEAIVEESGCALEKQAVSRFRAHVLGGNWDLAVSDVRDLAPLIGREEDVRQMRMLILEQKYLELIEKDRVSCCLQEILNDAFLL